MKPKKTKTGLDQSNSKAELDFRRTQAEKKIAELNEAIRRDTYRVKILNGWLSGDSVFRTPFDGGKDAKWELCTDGVFNWDRFLYQTVPGKKPCCHLDKDGDGQCPLHPDGIDPLDQADNEDEPILRPIRRASLHKALDQCEDDEP